MIKMGGDRRARAKSGPQMPSLISNTRTQTDRSRNRLRNVFPHYSWIWEALSKSDSQKISLPVPFQFMRNTALQFLPLDPMDYTLRPGSPIYHQPLTSKTYLLLHWDLGENPPKLFTPTRLHPRLLETVWFQSQHQVHGFAAWRSDLNLEAQLGRDYRLCQNTLISVTFPLKCLFLNWQKVMCCHDRRKIIRTMMGGK